MGTEEGLLIRQITCGHTQQRGRAELGRFPVSGLAAQFCASRPADIARRNPLSPSALHLAAARCQFGHPSLHAVATCAMRHSVSNAAVPLRCGVNLITACRGLQQP